MKQNKNKEFFRELGMPQGKAYLVTWKKGMSRNVEMRLGQEFGCLYVRGQGS